MTNVRDVTKNSILQYVYKLAFKLVSLQQISLAILNESTTFRNQITCVLFIILHCTTRFGLQAGHLQVLSDKLQKVKLLNFTPWIN
jgi:hypothetical protein